MESQFRQPKNVVNTEVNKQSIARNFGVADTEVCYAKPGQSLTGYKVIFDTTQQRAYSLPPGLGGTVLSMTSLGVLNHSGGSVDLGELAVTREEFVKLPGTFTTGVVVNTKNEVVGTGNTLYRWAGALPKIVEDNTTPEASGGISDTAWVSVGVASLLSSIGTGDLPGDINYIYGKPTSVAGAVTRTLQSKLDDYVSVKDFGAVGDGVTDDTAAIQAAVAYIGNLATLGMFKRKSTLFFPCGDYIISQPIILWDGVSLRGESQSSTRVTMTSILSTTGVTTLSPVRSLPRNVNCIVAVFSSVAGYVYRTAISDIQLYGVVGDTGVTTGKVVNAIYAPEAAFLTVDRVRTWYTNYGIMSYNLWMSSFRDLDLREHAEWSFLLSNDGTGRGGSTSVSLERVYGHTSEGGIKLYGANYSTVSSCGVDAAGSSNPSAADAAAKAPYVFESCQGLVASSLGAESIYTRRCIFIIGGHVTLNEPDLYAWRGDVTGRRMYGIHITSNGNLVLNGGRLWGIQFSAASATECFAIAQTDGINGSVQCNGSLISDASVDSVGVAIGNIFFGVRTYRGRTIQQEAGISRYQTNTLTLITSVTTGDLVASGLDTTRYTVIDAVAQVNSNAPTLDQAKLRAQVMNVANTSARIWILNPDGTANFTAQTLRVTFTYRVN